MNVPSAPRRVRKIPAPFQRPSISVSGGDYTPREWQHVRPSTLVPGDTVAQHGVVLSVDSWLDELTHTVYIVLEVGHPESRTLQLPDASSILAFVKKDV